MSDPRRPGILFELHQAGNLLKVSALDPETLAEAVVFGLASFGAEALKALAVRKLAAFRRSARNA